MFPAHRRRDVLSSFSAFVGLVRVGKLRGTKHWGTGFLSALQPLSHRLPYPSLSTLPLWVSLRLKGMELLYQVWLGPGWTGRSSRPRPRLSRPGLGTASCHPGQRPLVPVSLNWQGWKCNIWVNFKSPLLSSKSIFLTWRNYINSWVKTFKYII